jgi:RNA polymerase sigma-70 factor (sigma-E family)
MRDEDSYVAFVTARWSSLYRTSYLLTGDPTQAEDLLQNALLKAYVAWRRVRAAAAPEAYVRTILVNSLISDKRKRSATSEFVRADLPETPIASGEDAFLDRSEMWQRVCALPPRQRAVVVLRYYEDLTEQQIADTLECSVGTVKSQASDALRSLRRSFAATDASRPLNGEM